MEENKREFQISVITPVYNAEKYLEESIECVINQSIGFKKAVQLILINDGSKDSSDLICKKYKELYPDNIVYIEKENGGVSSARNAGLEKVAGKYLVFLDADDFWSKKSFERIYNFFEKHHDEVDVCSCRLKYTGDFFEKEHPLDYKYEKGSRVVNTEEESTYICTTIGNTVFKKIAVEGMKFDENMRYCEDSWFQNQVILNNTRIGIISNAIFYYRKNYCGDNASLNVIRQDSWYFDTVEDYYIRLLKYAKEQKGFIPRVIQETIFYDIKWRENLEEVSARFSPEKKKAHLDLLRQALLMIDDEVILNAEEINQFKKYYFLCIKYGTDVIKEATLIDEKYMYQGIPVLVLRARNMMRIRSIDIKDGMITLAGFHRLEVMKRDYKYFVMTDDGTKYPIETEDYTAFDIKGVVGELVAKMKSFKTTIPIKPNMLIGFYITVESETVQLKPSFEEEDHLTRDVGHSYTIVNDYILKYIKGKIGVFKNRKSSRIVSETLYGLSLLKREGIAALLSREKEVGFDKWCETIPIKNRVAFITVRSEDKLEGNLKYVYDAVDLPKVMYAKKDMQLGNKSYNTAKRIAAMSKVVVTDDYLFFMKDKRPGQKYVQLWHSTGAGKHFGGDEPQKFAPYDAKFHRHYNLVTVSSEHVRKFFARALSVSEDIVKATGVARTDEFYNESFMNERIKKIEETYPGLKDKEVILYTPTFRDIPGISRKYFVPELDFDELSKRLRDNQVFVICPHPVMSGDILKKKYDNIIENREIATNDMMLISDIMISDYSSTLFEYSLLRKPMAFFCYDYDTYDRQFYMDFDNELPGPILRTQEELFEYLAKEEHTITQEYEDFFQAYMGACDGHSTERIKEEIEKLMYQE